MINHLNLQTFLLLRWISIEIITIMLKNHIWFGIKEEISIEFRYLLTFKIDFNVNHQ